MTQQDKNRGLVARAIAVREAAQLIGASAPAHVADVAGRLAVLEVRYSALLSVLAAGPFNQDAYDAAEADNLVSLAQALGQALNNA